MGKDKDSSESVIAMRYVGPSISYLGLEDLTVALSVVVREM